MRHFIVLGFATESKEDHGKCLFLGSDRGAAIELTNTFDDEFERKELFELARPHKVCHFRPRPERFDTLSSSLDSSSLELSDSLSGGDLSTDLSSSGSEPSVANPGPELTAQQPVVPSPADGTDQPAVTPPAMSTAAKELAEKHQLTDAELAAIKPTGSSGNIVKEDVVAAIGAKESSLE